MSNRYKSIEQFLSLRSAFADKCEETIYHYTSADGLMGIILKNEIWLTNTAFVNDTTECKALNVETDLFTNETITNQYVTDSWNRFKQHLNRNDTYIASFSMGEDYLLEQLRSYGNFRIGFDAKKLIRKPFNLYKCVYDKNEITQWIRAKSDLEEWNAELLDDNLKIAAGFDLIYSASRKYKNKYFKSEREVRLIVHSNHTWEPHNNSPSMYLSDPPIHYRKHPGYDFPIPYVKFKLDDNSELTDSQKKNLSKNPLEMKRMKLAEERKLPNELLPITEILVGPMPHQKKAILACEILLKDNGYSNVKVVIKEIPYRGF